MFSLCTGCLSGCVYVWLYMCGCECVWLCSASVYTKMGESLRLGKVYRTAILGVVVVAWLWLFQQAVKLALSECDDLALAKRVADLPDDEFPAAQKKAIWLLIARHVIEQQHGGWVWGGGQHSVGGCGWSQKT